MIPLNICHIVKITFSVCISDWQGSVILFVSKGRPDLRAQRSNVCIMRYICQSIFILSCIHRRQTILFLLHQNPFGTFLCNLNTILTMTLLTQFSLNIRAEYIVSNQDPDLPKNHLFPSSLKIKKMGCRWKIIIFYF